MTKEALIKKTLRSISKLPKEIIMEVSGFADFILKKYDEEILQQGIEELVSSSNYMEWLKNEEDLYSVNDLKVRYK